jgi:hypothetical protein
MCHIWNVLVLISKGKLVKFVSVAKYFETVVDRAPRASTRPSCWYSGDPGFKSRPRNLISRFSCPSRSLQASDSLVHYSRPRPLTCFLVYHLAILSFRVMKLLYWKHPYFAFIQPTLNALCRTPSHAVLTDTSTRVGARRRHIQGVPSQLLALQHVKWFQTTVRPPVAELQPS